MEKSLTSTLMFQSDIQQGSQRLVENRQEKRFQCVQYGFQDYADRKAALLIGARGLEKWDQNVPAPNNPPIVTVRRCSNRLREPADYNPVTARGYQNDDEPGSVSS